MVYGLGGLHPFFNTSRPHQIVISLAYGEAVHRRCKPVNDKDNQHRDWRHEPHRDTHVNRPFVDRRRVDPEELARREFVDAAMRRRKAFRLFLGRLWKLLWQGSLTAFVALAAGGVWGWLASVIKRGVP